MALKKDSVVGTMIFIITLSLLCSFMITGTAELLKERKLVKKRDELKRYVLMASDVDIQGDKDFRAIFEKSVTPLLINIESGAIEPKERVEVMNFDERMAAINPEKSRKLERKKDKARIKTRADQVRVFQVFDEDGKLASLVLPIYGKGLWSIIYGYVALKPDFNTIENVVFYEHGETPGIGDFLNETEWTDKFRGKQIFDAKGKPVLKIVKGGAKEGDIHGVDAVSGATMTGRGVQRSIQFWFGSEGFKVFLDKLKASEV
ncbi:Na(+)-translocating NADH-quinone reductase subunit C [Shewanella sp.]|uniref:Na(+)-translocating NADH-quinone reductase subunit C n=1 Tax=Shewanella sp. TaxID=50422 RepID=UPI000C107992|nr:Na(+)-translocating NADH-quinone reductase subunit C [Shewanella sp.]MBL4815853.1 Na(+)-translocating NADH-quinone reductase subunit C [Shewanella sp.]MCJ8302475.1 Na(+)-translocating NADH-quinone reductase subunit C [Shewanella sp.]PHQ75392.1 MAG: Na(+)-translocating NADH-quinone reductase subunit C [Shewanella sp.]